MPRLYVPSPRSYAEVNPLTQQSIDEVLNDQEVDNDEDAAHDMQSERHDLNSAAIESRFKPNKLIPLEESYFKNCILKDYILFRNCILKLWLDDPFNRLDIKEVIRKLKLTEQDKILAAKIFKFLERYGYINHGVFAKNLPHKCINYLNHRYKIIVIGAGISGIIAARQLTYFGFDVSIVEASKRIGGRLYSFYKNNIFIDLGSSLISGIKGNPLHTIIKQLRKNGKKLKSKHKLYLDGEPVDKKKDLVIQNLFLLFLKFVYYLSIKKKINEINSNQLSPENLFDMFMYCLEVTAATKTLERFKKIFHIEENINIVMDKLEVEFSTFLKNADCFRSTNKEEAKIEETNEKLSNEEYDDIDYLNDFDDEVLENTEFSQILKSHVAFFKSVDLEEEYFNILGKFSELGKNDKFKDALEFFSLEDKRIIEWYFATLEYFLGAPLANYSLRAFAEDDLENCNSQFYCSDSYMSVLTSLFKVDYNLKVQKKTAVKTIQMFEDRVEIQATKNFETKTFVADAVVCTLPLGVLKRSLSNDGLENQIKFIPALPERKRSAISNLGFGSINKVVLCFEEKFWLSNDNYFGNVSLSRECRGEFVFYFNLYDQPAITAIICGDSIGTMDLTDDVVIVSKCYNTLKEIFENVPVPTMHTVSRWHQNPLFLGTHSYISTKSSRKDFDALAEPVSFSADLLPRLFFAGEHTNSTYPASVHGAFLSGLRVAAEVANRFDKLNFNN